MLSKTVAQRLCTRTAIRTFSTSPPIYNNSNNHDAASIASAFLSRFQSQGPQTRTQVLDANQLQLLSLTLNRPTIYPDSPHHLSNAPAPSTGTAIPAGHHLVYFTPAFLESELGADGTDTSYNPSPPFTRRMWAGGEVSWPRRGGKPNLLRVGQTVSETTRVLSAEAKVVRKTGEAMIVVGIEKTLANEEGVAVVDRRNWVFRPALPYPPAPKMEGGSSSLNVQQQQQQQPQASLQTSSDSSIDGIHKRRLKRSSVTLFRFSALTFNPHKIHYDLPWARDVEGHKNIVVHGPLNLISILDFWRDLQHKSGAVAESELVVPRSISYRATSPLYADEDYEIVLEAAEEEGGKKVNIYDHSGTVAMKAEIKE